MTRLRFRFLYLLVAIPVGLAVGLAGLAHADEQSVQPSTGEPDQRAPDQRAPDQPILASAKTTAEPAKLADSKRSRPNILYVYVDDMGWGSIGANGQAQRQTNGLPFVRTPNIDALARQGVNFIRGYGCTVCSPARSSQQTGFHQGHTFADRNDPDNAKKAIRSDDITIGDQLAQAGYATGYWGKWGYGGSKDQVDPKILNVQTLPTSHGYQFVLAELHHVRAHTFFQPTLWHAPAAVGAIGDVELIANSMADRKGNDAYPSVPALQNDPDYPATAYCDDCYAFAALDFVRAQGQIYHNTGRPFFGLLAVQVPHAPFDEVATLPQWNRAYQDDAFFTKLAQQSQQWAAMVNRIDSHLGNLLDALEDPNQDGDKSDSIARDTIVIFQSDNGGPSGKNNVQLDANGGLRGNKGSIFEGGIRVPLVVRWPAKIHSQSHLKAGTNSDMVVDVTDWLPTFCDLAGTTTPLGIDGVSIAPTLLSDGHQRQREFIIHEAGRGQSIIRGNKKLIRTKRSVELYDLANDPSESTNIADDHPALVKELQTRLIGERVTEPKGFANTYHHWTGADGESASDADHWSDYRYENAGVTYITDNGAPRLAWVAHAKNTTDRPNTMHVDSDVSFLAIEIGNTNRNAATQTARIDPKVKLTGRNEVRVSQGGVVDLDHGTISSLRWVDIKPNGTLKGTGSIEATLFNQGTVDAASSLSIAGDFRQTNHGQLNVSAEGKTIASVDVSGSASLAGKLSVSIATDFKPVVGQSFTILSANRVEGRFANEGDLAITPNGVRFSISYQDASVSLTTIQ